VALMRQTEALDWVHAEGAEGVALSAGRSRARSAVLVSREGREERVRVIETGEAFQTSVWVRARPLLFFPPSSRPSRSSRSSREPGNASHTKAASALMHATGGLGRGRIAPYGQFATGPF
jgi:hypothetical protein